MNYIDAILKEELSQAKEAMAFHQKHGDRYGLARYFDGQVKVIQAIKRKLKKHERNNTKNHR